MFNPDNLYETAKNQIAFGRQPFDAASNALESLHESREYLWQQFFTLAKHLNPDWQDFGRLKDLMMSATATRPYFVTREDGTLRLDGKLNSPTSGVDFLKEIMNTP